MEIYLYQPLPYSSPAISLIFRQGHCFPKSLERLFAVFSTTLPVLAVKYFLTAASDFARTLGTVAGR
jgi:hypothetical protein